MFASFMVNAWIGGTIVALVAGVVGFFVVLRGNAFLAHAVPHGAFAGAAGAVLVGVNPLVGLGLFALGGATGIVLLGRRARHDVVTALGLVTMLGLGALFLSRSREYSAEVFALLFGQILGVSTSEIVPMAAVAVVCLALVGVFFRPLLVGSVLPQMAYARRVHPAGIDLLFALVVAAATTVSVPVVGALLMFALLVGPPAAARFLTSRPTTAIALSVAFALLALWSAIALAYVTDLPIGFFATAIGALLYTVARLVTLRRSRSRA